MRRKYLRIHEVVEICGVEETFIHRLEEEEMIRNLEGVEVALHMREQMIALQRRFEKALRRLKKQMEK